MSLSILLIGLTTTACQTSAIGYPPAERLICEAEPGRPIGLGEAYVDPQTGQERREVTNGEDVDYKTALRVSGQSCRDDVNWLRDFFERLREASARK